VSRLAYHIASCIMVVAACAAAELPLAGLRLVLEYRGRYVSQPGEPDHLLDAVAVGGTRAVVLGNRGLALVDTAALPGGGSNQFLDRLQGLNARSALLLDETDLVVNLNIGETDGPAGFAVVKIEGTTLRHLTTVHEPGVLYERMAVQGSRLFVAAHSAGLRIFDLTDPENPVLLGRLDEGLDDAWAVAVDGTTVWVADGGGGLKVVDATDPAHPVLLGGEDPGSASGTAEAVTVRDGTVYVAAGGAGVCAYPGGDPGHRSCLQLDGYARDLAWLGNDLAVATGTGVWILETGADGELSVAGHEIAARRGSGTLRLCYGVAALDPHHLLACDWSAADLFTVTGESTQPDILCSHQRIRFPPQGGAVEVTIVNGGGGPLHVDRAEMTGSPAFSSDLGPAVLDPGASLTFTIAATPVSGDDEGLLSIVSDDPDENPLPIQLFAATPYLDPGEPMPDFSLPAWRPDPQTGQLVQQTFTLSEHRGQVVWLQVFGFW